MTFHRLALLFSVFVLATSTVIHIDTFAPGVGFSTASWMWLHVVVLLTFGASVVGIVTATPAGMTKPELNRLVIRAVPSLAKLWFFLLMGYAAFNFVTSIQRGTAEQRGGTYVLVDHGAVLRELTRDEYERHHSLVVRGFSGHWIVFSFISVVSFAWVRPAVLARESSR